MTRIIVRKEKHGTQYYLAATEAQLHAAALRILAERMNPDYPLILEPTLPDNDDDLTEEQIAALPSPSHRVRAREAKATYDREWRMYGRARRQWDDARLAVRDGDGAMAVKILTARRTYEYEGFEIADAVEVTSQLPTALRRLLKLDAVT